MDHPSSLLLVQATSKLGALYNLQQSIFFLVEAILELFDPTVGPTGSDGDKNQYVDHMSLYEKFVVSFVP